MPGTNWLTSREKLYRVRSFGIHWGSLHEQVHRIESCGRVLCGSRVEPDRRRPSMTIYSPDTLTAGATTNARFVGFSEYWARRYAGGNESDGWRQRPSADLRLPTAGYDTVFNGHNYLSYNAVGTPDGLLTGYLFSGNSPRTVAGVYDTPAYVEYSGRLTHLSPAKRQARGVAVLGLG